MKDQNLDVVIPILFNGIPLIPITAKVEKLFKNKVIKFQIKIKDNKLILESPEILADLGLQDDIPESEVINVQ